MATGSLILHSYLITAPADKADELRYEEKVQALLTYNKQENQKKDDKSDFTIPLTIYQDILNNTDEVMLVFMPPEKKAQLLRDLQITYLLLLTQKKHELEHQKIENALSYDKQIKKCELLIDTIQFKQRCHDSEIAPAPHYGYASDGKTVAYLSLYFGQKFAEQMVDCMDSQTKTIKDNMGWVNEKRLYWVWASSLLKTTLLLLPSDFFNADQAQKVATAPDIFTGTMSWGLYYFRFALNLGLLLKHTIAGPWMSQEEQSIPWTERFTTQWAQRKFTLLNDSVWATGNLLCFFWLCGKGAAGTWGDMLTIGLLVFDIALAVWDYEEQKTKFKKEIFDYETNIFLLKKQLKESHDDDSDQEGLQKITELKKQLFALERAQKHCQQQWDYQNIILATNISYAVGLMLAFILLASPFFPFAAGTILALTVAGAVLCFAFSVICNGIKGGLEIHKIKVGAKEREVEYEQKLNEFKALLKNNPNLDDNEKKFLYLEIKKLELHTQYQADNLTFQTMHLIRSVLFEALIPALVFASLVFFPLGVGLAAIGATIALAICTNMIINATWKPEEQQLKTFPEEEYITFCAAQHKKTKSIGFFAPGYSPETGKENKTAYDDGGEITPESGYY